MRDGLAVNYEIQRLANRPAKGPAAGSILGAAGSLVVLD
jgi:hypothetical protein